jgi:hypothetical protein
LGGAPANLTDVSLGVIHYIPHFTPASLRGECYDEYVTSWMDDHDEECLRILQQSVANANGVAVLIDISKPGDDDYLRTPGGLAKHCLRVHDEVLPLAIVLAVAINDNDPAFFDGTGYLDVVKTLIARAVRLKKEVSMLDRFNGLDSNTMITNLRTSPDTEDLRHRARRLFNTTSTEWTMEVLGF